MRVSAYPLIEAGEASAIVLERVRRLGTESVALADATGRVLAEDLAAAAPVPADPVSAVDGFAVRAADGGRTLRVTGESAAGVPFGGTVEPGTAVRILTGGVLPDGADCVVMLEDARLEGGTVTVPGGLRPGANFDRPGDDLRKGDVVVSAGTQLGAAELGLAAAINSARLTVVRRPRVALLSTGEELVEAGSPTRRGQIPDSNRWALLAALREAGAEVELLGIAPDRAPELRDFVTRALPHADVLVTSGGVSVGTHDLVKPLLESLGTVHVGRVKLKPGKPFTFATLDPGSTARAGLPPPVGGGKEGLTRIDAGPWTDPGKEGLTRMPAGPKQDPGKEGLTSIDAGPWTDPGKEGLTSMPAGPEPKLAFGLPGFPVSSLVTFEVFVRPALRKMQGFSKLERPTLPVRLGFDAQPTPDRTEYHRVTLHREGRDLVASSTGSQSSSRLMSLAGAHALVRVPPGGQGLKAGQYVEAMILTLP